MSVTTSSVTASSLPSPLSSTTSQPPPLLTLDLDTWLHVLLFLSHRDVLRLRGTCREICALIHRIDKPLKQQEADDDERQQQQQEQQLQRIDWDKVYASAPRVLWTSLLRRDYFCGESDAWSSLLSKRPHGYCFLEAYKRGAVLNEQLQRGGSMMRTLSIPESASVACTALTVMDPNRNALAYAGFSDGRIVLAHAACASVLREYTHHEKPVTSVLSIKDRLLASSLDGTISVWLSPTRPVVLKIDSAGLNQVIFDSSHHRLCTISNSGSLVTLDAVTAQLVSRVQENNDPLFAMAQVATLGWIACGGNDRKLRVFDHRYGDFMNMVRTKSKIRSIASFDTKLVVGDEDGVLSFYDARSLHRVVAQESVHRSAVISTRFSLDGSHVYAGDMSGFVSRWELDDAGDHRLGAISKFADLPVHDLCVTSDALLWGTDASQLGFARPDFSSVVSVLNDPSPEPICRCLQHTHHQLVRAVSDIPELQSMAVAVPGYSSSRKDVW